MRKLLPGLMGLLLLGATVPCSAQTSILLSIHKVEGFHNAFWDNLRAGAQQEAAALGVSLTIQGVDPAFEADPAPGQVKVIRQALTQGTKAVILTPGDRLKLVGVVQEAVLASVPVVCIDAPVETTLLSALVATDNYQGGLDAARRMATAVGPRGQVVVLAHPSLQNQAISDRLRAFLSGLKQFGPTITVLSSDRAGKATLDTDTPVVGGVLRDFPTLTGLYTVSGSGTTGALRALQAAGKAGKVVLIGWDGDAESLAGVNKGLVDAVIQQDARSMGAQGVRAAWETVQGKAPKKSVLIPATVVTKGNLFDPSVQAILGPLGSSLR